MTNPYKAVLDNEQHAIADRNYGDNVFNYYLENGKTATLEHFNLTEPEFLDSLSYPQEEEFFRREGDDEDGVHSSSWTPPGVTEQQMAEWEGDGITSELIPGETAIADTIVALADKAGLPPEAALLAAGIVSKNPKYISKDRSFDSDEAGKRVLHESDIQDGMFDLATPKMNKKGKPVDNVYSKSGVLVGDVKKGGLPAKPKQERGLAKTKQEQGLTKSKQGVDAKVGLTQRNAEKATAGTLTGSLLANRMLTGDRDEDGTLKTIGKSYSGGATFEGYPVEGHPELAEPIKEEKVEAPKEERPGWYKPEGSNFWSVKTDSPHWQTDEGAAEAESIYGELPSWAKQPEVKEFNWSNWF